MEIINHQRFPQIFTDSFLRQNKSKAVLSLRKLEPVCQGTQGEAAEQESKAVLPTGSHTNYDFIWYYMAAEPMKQLDWKIKLAKTSAKYKVEIFQYI